MKIKCLDFHRLEWNRPLVRYYVKFADGRIIRLLAHDAVDAKDAVDDGTVVEYGNE